MGNTLAYSFIAAAFLALIVLNPSQERHERTFMDYAHAHFFELPKNYQKIYEQLRDNALHAKASKELGYGNFLLFSTLNHTAQKADSKGRYRPERRPLTVGALGFVWPITIEPQGSSLPAAAE